MVNYSPHSLPIRYRLLIALLGALLLSSNLLRPLPAQANHTVHVVKPGDTLSQIAKDNGTTTLVLRKLNGLSDDNFIWSGQRLLLPDSAVPAPGRAALTQTPGTHVVQAGDSLTNLAAYYGLTLRELAQSNQISPLQWLYVGQVLKVPVLGTAAEPQPPAAEADDPLPAAFENEAANAASEAGAGTTPASDAALRESRIHVVERGENLAAIASRYDTSPKVLIQANNLANPNVITPGQRLTVPPPSPEELSGRAPIGPDGYHIHTEFPTTTEKWIDVDLSEQRVVAYEGTTPVRSFIISSGRAGTPTITGTFRIWAKTPLQDMYGGNRASGDYYYLRDVPWVQYFHRDYAFHGTYWHTNWGQPMSRGCINMTNEDAKWLYEWASPQTDASGWTFSDEQSPGTLVMVHP